jgi:hypothetical protein
MALGVLCIHQMTGARVLVPELAFGSDLESLFYSLMGF